MNTVVITKVSLLKEFESMGVQLVSHEQANVPLSGLTLQPSLMKEIWVKLGN